MNTEEFRKELNFIGEKKKILWFNSKLSRDLWFYRLVKDIEKQREWAKLPPTNIRNLLDAIFPATEYLYDHSGQNSRQAFLSFNSFKMAVEINIGKEKLIRLAAQGAQGNIPQRAAVIMEFLCQNKIATAGENNILELGCSGGLTGLFFENHNIMDWERYSWLQKKPQINPEAVFHYNGYDLHIPEKSYLPFFLWDQEKRGKIKKVINNFQLKGNLVEQDLFSVLEGEIKSSSRTFIITSYLMHQIPKNYLLYQILMEKVIRDPHKVWWIDLSRYSEETKSLFSHGNFREGINYLSLNGVPRLQAINPNDDWADWQKV